MNKSENQKLHYTFKILLIFILSIPAVINGKVFAAGDTVVPFSSLHIRLNLANNVNRSTFLDFWKPEPGGELVLDMPFYYGSIEAGMLVCPFKGKSIEQPDYLNIFLYLGWGLDLEILKGFTWYSGIQIGNYQMYFDDYEIHESQRIESELGVGLSTRVGFNITNSWMVQGILTYQYVYTKKPLEFFILKAGIGYGFDAPKWLQEFLK